QAEPRLPVAKTELRRRAGTAAPAEPRDPPSPAGACLRGGGHLRNPGAGGGGSLPAALPGGTPAGTVPRGAAPPAVRPDLPVPFLQPDVRRSRGVHPAHGVAATRRRGSGAGLAHAAGGRGAGRAAGRT